MDIKTRLLKVRQSCLGPSYPFVAQSILVAFHKIEVNKVFADGEFKYITEANGVGSILYGSEFV